MVLGNDAGPKKLEQINELKIVTLDEEGLVRKLEGMFLLYLSRSELWFGLWVSCGDMLMLRDY